MCTGLKVARFSNVVYDIYQDSKGFIWLTSYNGKASCLKNNKICNSTNDTLCRAAERAGLHYDEQQSTVVEVSVKSCLFKS
jgi:hypothetical protein